jgi:hypothetical protein
MIFTLDIADIQKIGDGVKLFTEDEIAITLYVLQNGNVFKTVYDKAEIEPEQIIMWRERYLDRAIRCMSVEKEISLNLSMA